MRLFILIYTSISRLLVRNPFLQSVTLRSKHTKILESSITIDGSEMLQLSERLVGRSYGKLRDGEMDGLKAGEREVWEWLKEVIG